MEGLDELQQRQSRDHLVEQVEEQEGKHQQKQPGRLFCKVPGFDLRVILDPFFRQFITIFVKLFNRSVRTAHTLFRAP